MLLLCEEKNPQNKTKLHEGLLEFHTGKEKAKKNIDLKK